MGLPLARAAGLFQDRVLAQLGRVRWRSKRLPARYLLCLGHTARNRARRCRAQPVLWRPFTNNGEAKMRKRMSIRPIVIGVLSLAAAGCTELPRTASVSVPPIPPGE